MFKKIQFASLFIFSILSILALIVFIHQFVQASVAAAVNAPLFTDASTPDQRQENEEIALRSRYVTVNFDKLNYLSRSPQPYLELPLFNDVMVTAEYHQINQFENGAFVWEGKDPSNIYSDIQLSINGEILVGTIHLYDSLYRISYIGDGIHRIEQLPLQYRPDAEPILPKPNETAQEQTPTNAPLGTSTDDGSVIDVMVLYTPAVVDAMGSTEATQALINLAVSETNTGYDNSNVNFDLRLVHTELVNYQEVEPPNSTSAIAFTSALDAVTYTNDGQIDHIHALRDAHFADIVVLLIDGKNFCGVAWLMSNESPNFEDDAFNVVQYSCATGYYSFGHEIGHNMGSNHNREHADSGAFPYSYGYRDPNGQFRTVMAYGQGCQSPCPRVNHWSNSAVTYNGLPTGIDSNAADSAANYLSLNNTADTVANFRVSAQETTPTPTPTSTTTPTATPSPTYTPEPTLTPTPSPTLTPTPISEIEIPVTGGIVQINYLIINVPEGTFDDTVIFEFESLSPVTLLNAPLSDRSFTRDYHFRLHATYASSGLPAEPRPGREYAITIMYEESPQALNLIDETTLGLYYWDQTTASWQKEASSFLNTGVNTITASLNYFGTWAVLGESPTRTFVPVVVKE